MKYFFIAFGLLLFIATCVIENSRPAQKHCCIIEQKYTHVQDGYELYFLMDKGVEMEVERATYHKHSIGDSVCILDKKPSAWFLLFFPALGFLFLGIYKVFLADE